MPVLLCSLLTQLAKQQHSQINPSQSSIKFKNVILLSCFLISGSVSISILELVSNLKSGSMDRINLISSEFFIVILDIIPTFACFLVALYIIKGGQTGRHYCNYQATVVLLVLTFVWLPMCLMNVFYIKVDFSPQKSLTLATLEACLLLAFCTLSPFIFHHSDNLFDTSFLARFKVSSRYRATVEPTQFTPTQQDCVLGSRQRQTPANQINIFTISHPLPSTSVHINSSDSSGNRSSKMLTFKEWCDENNINLFPDRGCPKCKCSPCACPFPSFSNMMALKSDSLVTETLTSGDEQGGAAAAVGTGSNNSSLKVQRIYRRTDIQPGWASDSSVNSPHSTHSDLKLTRLSHLSVASPTVLHAFTAASSGSETEDIQSTRVLGSKAKAYLVVTPTNEIPGRVNNSSQ